MGTLLRLGGISLIIGTLVLSLGGYASFRGAQMEKVSELVPGIAGSAEASEGWVSLAPWVGITLMALGLLAAVTVLVLSIRAKLAPKTYVSYADGGRKLRVGSSPGSKYGVVQDTDDIITILNNMLQVEYAQIVNWPRWVSRITNPDAAEKLTDMGRDSMRHFDTNFAIIRKLGGTPSWGFRLELDKDESDLRQVLVNQLDKEKLAKMGYQRAAELTSDENLHKVLLKLASDEESHIKLLEEALVLL